MCFKRRWPNWEVKGRGRGKRDGSISAESKWGTHRLHTYSPMYTMCNTHTQTNSIRTPMANTEVQKYPHKLIHVWNLDTYTHIHRVKQRQVTSHMKRPMWNCLVLRCLEWHSSCLMTCLWSTSDCSNSKPEKAPSTAAFSNYHCISLRALNSVCAEANTHKTI